MSAVIIPMAGAGSRFSAEGYEVPKPLILLTDRRSGKKFPMVVAATMDIPNVTDSRLIYVDLDFHRDTGVEAVIRQYFGQAQFITIDYLTEGQASTCLLATPLIDPTEDLFIGACDTGISLEVEAFELAKSRADALVITHRHDMSIARQPNAHSWCVLAEDARTITSMSIKKSISPQPMTDHATTGLFWFKRGEDFIRATETMIAANDRVGNEFYVDQVMQYLIKDGLKVEILDGIYLGWGTPQDYTIYEQTQQYWRDFLTEEARLS